jgi:hypothetical protein
MANYSTEGEKRDFLAKEIKKRIVGPGFAQDVFICSPDASDEILTERPQVVYSSGILYPATNKMEDKIDSVPEVTIDENGNLFSTDVYDNDTLEDALDAEDVSLESEGSPDDAEEVAKKTNLSDINFEDALSDERAGFNPNRIGMICCLKEDTKDINIEVKYGRYKIVPESEWEECVKVPLDGRCPLDTLKETFDYYDKYAKELLTSLGVNSVYDLFSIDERNHTISPKKKLSIQVTEANDEKKEKYVHPSSFPALLRNKAAKIFLDILDGKEVELNAITWNDFRTQIKIFDEIDEIKEILSSNGWESLFSHIKFDVQSQKVTLTGRRLNTEGLKLSSYLYIADPVRDYVLDKLLEYRYFKRYSNSKSVVLKLDSLSGKEDLGDGVILHWKAFSGKGTTPKKYIRILLQNCTEVKPRSGEIPHMFQTEITLKSAGITSYSEPQTSLIDDEFNLNEKLYSDELVYGKGVNCAVEWKHSENENPTWVKTTYTPAVKVRAFSTAMNDQDISGICDIHNLSIWGVTDEEIIKRLNTLASKYSDWMKQQAYKAGSDPILKSVIDAQQKFYERLVDSIDYLGKTPRALKCFRLANTAMYIQMLLGKDSKFKKGRDKSDSDYNSDDIFFNEGCWDYFRNKSSIFIPAYYPFQLAFLVINVKSTFEPNDPYRNDYVDLIWFPTGGGKTEAYLALTALTIAERRTSGHSNTNGVSVIMRYTLRLLTAQQFERASFLICALEYMRNHFIKFPEEGYALGENKITIGMWVGKDATPNKITDLSSNQSKYSRIFSTKKEEDNKFPIVYCPWCGCNLVAQNTELGYRRNGDTRCLNEGCHFHDGLPIYYIDDQLYNNPPTLLFATVDKFAQLNTKTKGSLFGIGTDCRKPDLIIQDELHLISGPLGSLVGLFESLIEELATERDGNGKIIRTPKIIASTATTRNTGRLIKQLYKRNVVPFPTSGVKYSDNFFSHVLEESKSKRLYLGMSPTGHSASELEIRTIAAELVAKEKLITEWLKDKKVSMEYASIRKYLCLSDKLVKELDLYWTQVLYYTNLKSLGRTHSRIGQEIKATVENMKRFSESYPVLSFLLDGFYTRSTEFTSRQNSAEIKRLLIAADEATRIEEPQSKMMRVDSQMDLVQATNMISVGIDIDRWNVMIMVGQPLTTADYIQASSRAGRHHQGLVITLYNPLRSRELSYFENFASYHQVFYKFVEPLSVTTFTEMTLDKLLLNLYVGYMVLIKGKTYLKDVKQTDLNEFKIWLKDCATKTGVQLAFISSIDFKVNSIDTKLKSIDTPTHSYFFSDIIIPNKCLLPNKGLKHLMMNLRDVERNTYLSYE